MARGYVFVVLLLGLVVWFCESFWLRVASLVMASSTVFAVICHVSTSFCMSVVRTLRDGVLCSWFLPLWQVYLDHICGVQLSLGSFWL